MKQNLFVPEVKNHVSRNAFDLSTRKIYSQKLGEILPILVQDCLPGDRFKIKASSFTRTAPLNSAAFARMKQYYNFYFVPYRLLYRDFPSFVVQQSASSKAARGIQSDSKVNSSLPYTTESELFKITKSYYCGTQHALSLNGKAYDINTRLLNPVGLNRMSQMRKLLQYLGYYRVTSDDALTFTNSATAQVVASENNTPVSLFPLMAYQKVYNDFYRFSQWENEQANTYNVDYLAGSSSVEIPINQLFSVDSAHKVVGYSPDGSYYPSSQRPSMFDMRYVNYTKDSYLGVVPSSQFGAVSTVSADLRGDESVKSFYLKTYVDGSKALSLDPQGNVSTSSSDIGKKVPLTIVDNYGNTEKFEVNVLTLRAAQARQKFLEVTLSNNSDYKSQIEAHFNVNVSSLMSNLCDYIGGFSSDLSLNTIANQNLSDATSGSYSALATFSGNGDIDFESREHGLIIGVSYILPFIDWSVIGYDFPILRTEFSDFALPEFDRLGYEELDPRLPLGVQESTFDSTLSPRPYSVHAGYGPRYYDYKTNIDVCLGDFNLFQGGTQSNFVLTMRPNQHNLLTDQNLIEMPYNASDFHKYGSYGYISDLVAGGLNYASFKVSPQLTNLLFKSSIGLNYDSKAKLWFFHDDCSFDPFYNVCDFNISVVRNLDRLGLPY